MEKVFGIDLGTTYSCIAHIDESGKSVIIENAENERTTPSVVFFESADNVIVGNTAKNALETDPEKVVSFIKRDMGNPDFMPFEHEDKEFTAEAISSIILKKLANDAGDKLGAEVKKVVITCPAYFGNNEREATKNAGILAGLDVLAIINEPTAAAISYGVENQGDQTVLVYDLGGGTFDVTIIKISAGKIEVVATGGDRKLGGKNWDEAIINFLVDKFIEQSGIDEDKENILLDPETFGDLQLKAEVAKKDLTNRDDYKVRVMHGGLRENVIISREDFEEITAHLLEQTIQLTNSTIENGKNKEAGGITQIDKILLVGGSTKMPAIEKALNQTYSVPIETYKPDEAVALGAAIYAQNIDLYEKLIKLAEEQGVDVNDTADLKEKIEDGTLDTSQLEEAEIFIGGANLVENLTEIINVISRSYGVAAIVNSERKIYNLVFKDSQIPLVAKPDNPFGTQHDNQTSLLIELFENEYSDTVVDIEDGVQLIDGKIEGITPNLPKGSPVEVSISINNEGIMELITKELSSGKELRLEYESDAVLSAEQMKEQEELVGGIAVS